MAEHDDRAALLVDSGARADLPLDDEIPAPQRRARQGPGVALDDNDTRHHVFGRRPSDPSVDLHLRPVDQAAAEVAQTALEGDLATAQDSHPKRVPRARVVHGDLAYALLIQEPAQLEVDLPRSERAGIE